jgi:hypothetical protein
MPPKAAAGEVRPEGTRQGTFPPRLHNKAVGSIGFTTITRRSGCVWRGKMRPIIRYRASGSALVVTPSTSLVVTSSTSLVVTSSTSLVVTPSTSLVVSLSTSLVGTPSTSLVVTLSTSLVGLVRLA